MKFRTSWLRPGHRRAFGLWRGAGRGQQVQRLSQPGAEGRDPLGVGIQQGEFQADLADDVQRLPADHLASLVLGPQVVGDDVGVAQADGVGHVPGHDQTSVPMGTMRKWRSL